MVVWWLVIDEVVNDLADKAGDEVAQRGDVDLCGVMRDAFEQEGC